MVSPMEIQQADDVVLAEAVAWIARLQGSERTTAAEAAFREWLAADSAHGRAFSRATEVWELIPGAARSNITVRSNLQPSFNTKRRVSLSLAACTAAVVLILGIAAFLLHSPTYTTDIGQQRTITLSDGTRVSLNTHSQLVVAYTEGERRVRLERGEGLFEVAQDVHRPFVVQAGDEQVRALGTTFLVRKEHATLAVTLIEGRIELASHPLLASNASPDVLSRDALLLSPGERATVRAGAALALDRPKVEALTAWRRGEVMFDDASLQDAVSEINRYGDVQVVIAEPALAQLRVSGVFATQDPREFAQAMARLHHLSVRTEGSSIRLER